jgi:superfamily II DNA/RNA helicase
MDLFGRGKILLTGCSLLVIDEADRMLDMGFIPDIEEICSRLPKNRQTLLFSATMPPPIKKLADKFLTDPKMLEVSRPASANLNIEQRVIITTSAKKRDVLRDVLRHEEVKNAIVFSNRKTTVRDLATSLKKSGFKVGQIHGDMEQAERIAEFDRFKDGTITILVASDVAARGLDVKGVSHVVNFDVPWQPDDYVHRIGRTGRAGLKGIAITLATKEDAEAVAAIEKLTATKIARFSGDGASEGAPAAAPAASEVAPREKRERIPRAKAAPKAAPAPKPEPAPERASRAEEPRRDRAPRQDRPRREEPRYEREEKPVEEPKLVADADPEWNGPMPSFLSFGAS